MPRAGLTAERVTTAGAELADEVGFDHLTVSMLAQRLDVATASLYSHVRSSQDLRTRIALLALQELADRGAEAIAGRSGKAALSALAGVYRDYAREHPGRYASLRTPFDARTAARSAGPRHTRMLQAILRDYHLADEEQTHAIRLLGSVFHGYVSLELAGSFDHSLPGSQQSWPRIMDALDALLRTWPAISTGG